MKGLGTMQHRDTWRLSARLARGAVGSAEELKFTHAAVAPPGTLCAATATKLGTGRRSVRAGRERRTTSTLLLLFPSMINRSVLVFLIV